jgi:cytochrome c oxidase subunit 5a
MSASVLRVAARGYRAAAARPVAHQLPLMARSVAVMPSLASSFSTSMPRRSEHAEETFEEFSAR